jgi:hypothetical protein
MKILKSLNFEIKNNFTILRKISLKSQKIPPKGIAG